MSTTAIDLALADEFTNLSGRPVDVTLNSARPPRFTIWTSWGSFLGGASPADCRRAFHRFLAAQS